jgi:Fur family ferric uptake transcriptional regulator
MTYNTKQKDLILSIIKSYKHSFTVNDIYEQVKDNTGLTTVYRLIDKLLAEGTINKTIDECEEKNHVYLKCDKCGNIIHTDCDCIESISKHMLKEHNFHTSDKHIIINGLCANCSKGVK